MEEEEEHQKFSHNWVAVGPPSPFPLSPKLTISSQGLLDRLVEKINRKITSDSEVDFVMSKMDPQACGPQKKSHGADPGPDGDPALQIINNNNNNITSK